MIGQRVFLRRFGFRLRRGGLSAVLVDWSSRMISSWGTPSRTASSANRAASLPDQRPSVLRLQAGIFELAVDGDLFKAEVTLPQYGG